MSNALPVTILAGAGVSVSIPGAEFFTAGATALCSGTIPVAMGVGAVVAVPTAYYGYIIYQENKRLKSEAENKKFARDASIVRESIPVRVQMRAEICEELKIAKEEKLIGFVGHVNSGKSYLTNAVRGVANNAPEAARVGPIECTTRMGAYRFAGSNRTVLLDLPGWGTRDFVHEEYCSGQKIAGLDVLCILLSDGCVDGQVVALAKYAVKNGVDTVLLRSKCDNDLRDELRDCTNEAESLQAKQTFVSNCKRSLSDELRKWEDQHENGIRLAGLRVLLVSAPAIRAIVACYNNLPYDQEDLRLALPDDFIVAYSFSISNP